MRDLRKIPLFLVCLILIPSASGAAKLDEPRSLPPVDGLVTSAGHMPGGEATIGLQGMGTGRPQKLAALSSWITSDYEPTDFNTNVQWFDFEYLRVYAWFTASSTKEIKATMTLLDANRTLVMQNVINGTPNPTTINGVSYDLAWLPPGSYEVRVKIKQGKQVVGIRYWLDVQPGFWLSAY